MKRFFLTVSLIAATLLATAIAGADSKTVGSTTITGDRKGSGWSDKDNVVGKLTDTDKSGKVNGLGGVTITIKGPKGAVVGTGKTAKDGSYDIDTNMDSVEGFTLTFTCDHIDAELTMKLPERFL
jgi:hypothetical protein